MKHRGSLWPWLAVPWRERSVAVAIIVAAAIPSMMLASAQLWRVAAEDEVTARIVQDASLRSHGVDLVVETSFDPSAVANADRAIDDALADVTGIGLASRTLHTLPGLVTIGPSTQNVGPAAQIVARDGALDAVEIVDQLAGTDTEGGVWVTTWFAQRHGLELGDVLGFEAGAIADEQFNDVVPGGGARAGFRVVGTYVPVWSPDPEDRPDPYWAAAPPAIVPVFIEVTQRPNVTLVLTEEDTLLTSGLTGLAQWEAPLVELPRTLEGLRDLRSDMRSFERDTVGPGPLGAAMVDLATVAGRRPILSTELFSTTQQAEQAADVLRSPLSSATLLGVVIGILGMVAVGMFFVERRRSEFRVLASEGEPVSVTTLRIGAQLAAPVAVGSALGAGAALFTTRWFGPADSVRPELLPVTSILLLGVASCLLAAVSAGASASRVLRTPQPGVRRALGILAGCGVLGGAALAWVQVGRTTAASSIDLVAVALPVLVVLASLIVVMTAMAQVLRRSGRWSRRLPMAGYLAARRLAAGDRGLMAVAGMLGLGVGLVVFALAITSTLERTVDVKLATQLGGETSLRLSDELPAGFDATATTIIRRSNTAVTPGRVNVRVLAVDLETYADAVAWPSAFGSSADEIVATLDLPVESGAIPAVAVRGQGLPATGSFGLFQAYPYEVVATVEAVPLAADKRATLLISAASLDRLALDRAGFDTTEDASAAGVRLPTSRFGRVLIADRDRADVVAALDAAGVQYFEVDSRNQRRSDPDLLATRSAFGYLGVLGAVAAAGSIVALVLYLSARRADRALTGVMVRSMGMSPGGSAAVTAVEFALVFAVAAVAAIAAAPLAVSRLSRRFDPLPDLPPVVAVDVSWGFLALVSVATVASLAISVWVIERRQATRPEAEVLRHAR